MSANCDKESISRRKIPLNSKKIDRFVFCWFFFFGEIIQGQL